MGLVLLHHADLHHTDHVGVIPLGVTYLQIQAIRGEDNVLDEVRVAGYPTAGNTVGLVLLSEVPQDDGFAAGRGVDHVRVVDGGGNGSDHVAVSTHGAAKNKTLCHLCF